MVAKHRILAPRRGFYVVVPGEYRDLGSPPVSWFIDDLMAFLGVRYYVGLLSAASLHGAAHQAPQEFQVVCAKPLRSIRAGRQVLRFVVSRTINPAHITRWKTPTGSMAVSTPEATALDLVRHPRHCGQLGNVATVLSELAEAMDPGRLASFALDEVAATQRLGWLLEKVGVEALADAVYVVLQHEQLWWVPLVAGEPRAGVRRNERWHILENVELEFET
jgi:predicted transcriptional regulator of viral defense system